MLLACRAHASSITSVRNVGDCDHIVQQKVEIGT